MERKTSNMKTRIILFLLSLISLNAMGQGTITRETCKTCGKVISQCQYKGKHTKPQPAQPAKKVTTQKPLANKTPRQSAKPTSVTINGHEWIDLGLSVKWATCNVGASKPEDCGVYFAWGDTRKYKRDNPYTIEANIGDIAGNSEHDAAREYWGKSWRLPTKAEWDELVDKCTWEWAELNGQFGYRAISMYNGNSIFIPAAGDSENPGNRSSGWYWSSMPVVDNPKFSYSFSYGHPSSGCAPQVCKLSYRSYGYSIRPVTE